LALVFHMGLVLMERFTSSVIAQESVFSSPVPIWKIE
jgi:hypothetical protein